MSGLSRMPGRRALAAAVTVVATGAGVVTAGPAAASGSAGGAAVAAASTAGTAADSAAACRLGWNASAKASSPMTSAAIRNIRSGRHACFDRLVVDLKGSRTTTGYHVQYVGQVTQDGSGRVVPLRGAAKLQVVVRAPAHDARYRPTYTPRRRAELVNVGGYRTFRQVAWAGSFEGQTTLGLGVRARLPFKVATVRTGTTQMLIIDVAHSW